MPKLKQKKKHEPLVWISRNVVFPHSAGASLAGREVGPYLLDFQVDIIQEILSPDGEIQKNCFIFGCRKISKSFLYSAILWYLINDPNRHGLQIPVLASVYEQGKIIYNQLLSQFNEEKKQDFVIRKDHFVNKWTKSKIHILFNASSSNLGLESSGLVADEIGAYKNDENLLTVQTGLSLTEGKPLQLFSSNPPSVEDHFVVPLIRACEKDDRWTVHKFAAKISEDWQSEQVWRCNPFINEFFQSKGKKFANVMDFYRQQFKRAVESKSDEMSFRRLLLGQLLHSGALEYIPISKVKVCDESVYARKDLRWTCGIDASLTHDFTSMVFVGYRQGLDHVFVKPFLYLPNIKKRRQSQVRQFKIWESAGYIKIQNADVLQCMDVANDFDNFLRITQIKLERVVFDVALSHYFDELFPDHKVEKIKMTGREMTASVRALERIGNAGGLHLIGENPAYKWMLQNVIVSQKSKNYVLMDRANTMENIDGPVGTTLGLKWLIENKKFERFIYSR